MKKIIIVPFLIIFILTLILGACAAPPPATTTPTPPTKTTPPPVQKLNPTAEKPLELKFAYQAPPKASLVPGIYQPWTAEIEKASGGRIKITHYGGETLVKTTDAYDALASGICDIAAIDTEESPGRFPLAGISTLPFVYPSTELAGRISHELLNKYSANGELKEIKILITAPLHMAQIFSKRKIEVLNDFKNMKFRAAGKVEAWTGDAFGAIPVEVSTGDMSGALDRGMIEGCFFTWSAGLSFGVKDVTKYRTECNILSRAFVVGMNRQIWDKLPEDLQKVIDGLATPEVSQRYGAAHDKLAAGARGAIVGSDKGAGNPPIYVLPKEERDLWIKTCSVVYDTWVKEAASKNLPAQAMLDEAASLAKKYAQPK